MVGGEQDDDGLLPYRETLFLRFFYPNTFLSNNREERWRRGDPWAENVARSVEFFWIVSALTGIAMTMFPFLRLCKLTEGRNIKNKESSSRGALATWRSMGGKCSAKCRVF